MLNIVLRTAIVYVVLFFAMRIMGQKQAGQLQPYEIVVTLLIAEVAATPMDDPGTPILYGLIPAITLLLLYSLFNFVCLKSKRMRLFLCGRPSILIHDGKLLSQEIRRVGYNLNDLMEQLRLANCPSLSDVQYAIMESNGQLTVIPKAENKPLAPKDMQLTVSEGALPMLIISDGKLYEKNLHALGINKNALDAKLQNASLSDYRKIFLAFYDENKQIHVYLHNKRTSPFAAEVIL